MKSAHSTRNRYSSQWTLTKCQASTPARTLTSDWRTVGSQHGVTVTESDSYSASLSQDTGVRGPACILSILFWLPVSFHHLPFHSEMPSLQTAITFPPSWPLIHDVAGTQMPCFMEFCRVNDFMLFSPPIKKKKSGKIGHLLKSGLNIPESCVYFKRK